MKLASRAPAAWSREMARLVLPWAAVRRGARWLAELLGPPPRLRPEPLFGRTLPALLGAETAGEETPANALRGAAPAMERLPAASAARREPAEHRRRGRRAPLGEPPPHGNAEHVTGPPSAASSRRSAGLELLTRLAGRPPLADPGRSLSQPHRRPKPSPESAARPRRHVAAGDDGPRSRQLAELADRALARLRRGSPAASARAPGPPRPEARVLDGEAAPRGLLGRWLDSGEGTGGPRCPESPSSGPTERRSLPPAPADRAGGSRTAAGSAASAPPALPAATAPAAETAGATSPRQAGDEAAAAAARRPWLPDAAVLPPSLLPATAAGFSSASATRRFLGAVRTEETAGGEDVGELAERLGRYLAEEARRHGIDV